MPRPARVANAAQGRDTRTRDEHNGRNSRFPTRYLNGQTPELLNCSLKLLGPSETRTASYMHGSASKPLVWARENAGTGSARASTHCYMAGRNKSGNDEAIGYGSRRARNALRSLAGFPD